MGKVGSWTIIQSIRHIRPDLPMVDLSDAGSIGDSIVHTHSIENVRAWIEQKPADVSVCIISAVRDPLHQCISAFFQNFADASKKATRQAFLYVGSQQEILEMPAQKLVDHFRNNALERMPRSLENFTTAFGKLIAQNPYDFQFNENGLASGTFGAGRFHVMRLHRFRDALPDLGRHLKLSITDIVSENIGNRKWYASKYEEFLNLFKPTPSEIELYYDTPFARAYFTAAELSEFRAAWHAG